MLDGDLPNQTIQTDSSIALAADRPTQTRCTAESRIFLTGATGLIGGQIAQSLAHRVKSLSCLIRGKNSQLPQDRLVERFSDSSEDISNISSVSGDLHDDRLGLGSKDFEQLTESTDILIHCAAQTSFLQSKACEQTNVDGTRRLIEFAQKCERKPLLIYISTACNAGKMKNICLSEEDGCRPDNSHHNSYTHSKAISEKLIQESGLDALIIRPSIVLSAGINSSSFAKQIMWFAPLLNEFEALPLEADSRLDIIPVSFFTQSFLQTIFKVNRKYDLFHISASEQAYTVQDWVDQMSVHYERKTPLTFIPPSEWKSTELKHFVKTPRQRKIFFGLKYYLPFINMNVTFDNSRLEELLGKLNVPAPETYLSSLLSRIDLDEALAESQTP